MKNLTLNRIIASAALAASIGTGAFALTSAIAAPAAHAASPSLIQTHHEQNRTGPDSTGSSHVPFTIDNIWTVAQGSYDHSLHPNQSYQPTAGTYLQKIERSGGEVGQYESKDGNQITIGAAHGSFTKTQVQIASHSTGVPGFGPEVHVYELRGGGTYLGDYEVFDNGYWFSLNSNLFTTPQAVVPLIQAATQTIPAG
jgi:hypothetical protein